MADPWLNQEINPVLFNFAWVVPCEAFESNPEKYYHGQVLSSGTAISTNSPQDSLSLVDGDSMLDADVEDGARELELDEDVPGSECEFEAAEEERKNGMKDGWVPTATVIKVIEPNATGNGELIFNFILNTYEEWFKNSYECVNMSSINV